MTSITYATDHQPPHGDSGLLIYGKNPDGLEWEFTVEHHVFTHDLSSAAGPKRLHATKVMIFDDAYQAFADIPEFFAKMAELQPTDLSDVRTILIALGAIDQSKP